MPTVAIVGRANVGKSTLFNRLVGRRRAIVHGAPGVTRDRISGTLTLDGDRRVHLIDTGGLVLEDDELGLNEQVTAAVEESDLLLFVVDGAAGLVAADEEVWGRLRRHGKPALLVVNKADVRAAREHLGEFHRLGITPVLPVSAEHALGIGDLVEALEARLPEGPGPPAPDGPALTLVGRPNVGKSSLLNRLLGEPRALVSPVAGTTRDPVDTLLEREGRRYVLVDTAGIRRRSKLAGAPDELAVMMARRQIERADLAVLVLDATEGATAGDLAIGGTIWEEGKAAVVAVNKWDLLDDEGRERLEASWSRLALILGGPGRVNTSALTGRGVERLLPAVEAGLAAYRLELGTAEVNEIFQEAVAAHRPPAHRGRPWKLYYATQVRTGPPTFMLFANRTLSHRDAYRRYLENRLRERLHLPGVPVRLVIRRRGEKS